MVERREMLAAVLSGAADAPEVSSEDVDGVMQFVGREGVVALLSLRLDGQPDAPEALREACREWTREHAAAELSRLARVRTVLAALDEAGISVLVLKGTALAQWLYPAPYLRESSDVDLLFASRDDALRAAGVLAPLGYVMPYRPARFRHELLCRSADGGLDLDLHWRLSGWPVLARLPDYAALQEASIPLPGLGARARGLGAPHALLHACVHRASNLSAELGDRLKWLYDMHLLAAALDKGDWGAFLRDATQAQACGICAEGLAASARLFGTIVPADAVRALEEERISEPLDASRLADWRYMQRTNYRALDGWRNRLAWLWHRLLPPLGHMRELYGEEYGTLALLWLRLRRVVARVTGAGHGRSG